MLVLAPVVFAGSSSAFDPSDDYASQDYHPETGVYLQGGQHQLFFGLTYGDYGNGTKGKSFIVTPGDGGETDYLLQKTNKGQLGVSAGYAHQWVFGNASLANSYGASLGVSFQYNPGKFSGFTNQGAPTDPAFNKYSYIYRVSPIDILGQGTFYLMNMNHAVLPYVTSGVGFSVVSMKYSETPLSGVSARITKAVEQTGVTPLFVVGAGLQFNMSQTYFLKLEYLYHLRGSAGITNAAFAGRIPVNLNEQTMSVLFGVAI